MVATGWPSIFEPPSMREPSIFDELPEVRSPLILEPSLLEPSALDTVDCGACAVNSGERSRPAEGLEVRPRPSAVPCGRPSALLPALWSTAAMPYPHPWSASPLCVAGTDDGGTALQHSTAASATA